MVRVGSFLGKIRWKVYFYEDSVNDDLNQNGNNFELNWNLTPAPNNYLNKF